eukprot:g13238.t1
MTRSSKRSIFLQIVLYSITGLYTMYKDKKMELMMFATGNIYRNSGTALKDAEDEEASEEVQRRQSVKLLAQEYILDESLKWRVKLGQYGIGSCGMIAVICYIAAHFNIALLVGTMVFGGITIIFFAIMYYRNISIMIMKRLSQELNVVVIVTYSFFNWAIDIGRPHNLVSPVLGLIYLLVINAFIFIDAVKLKSRKFVVFIGSVFIMLNLYNIYGNTLGNWNHNVILLKYTVYGEEYKLMKRSIKRSMFLQMILFSMSGVYTMFKDKNMELMIFATGNICRKTGTASKDVEDKSFARKVEREKKASAREIL